MPSSDPHLSEYLPERWQGRQWLSGFTGSIPTDANRAARPNPAGPVPPRMPMRTGADATGLST